MNKLCKSPNTENLKKAKNTFLATVDSWAAIEWFRIGPVMRKNRIERFFFFPDRKSTGLRQIKSVLVQKKPEVLSLTRLQEVSVALQGIGTLDYLLFGHGGESLTVDNHFRCSFARNVSRNLRQIALALSELWKDNKQLRADWLKPNKSNLMFHTKKEAMNTITSILIHGLEAIRDTRINTFLRSSPEKDRPKPAPLWRSQATIRLVTANLQGLEDLFNNSRIESLLPPEADNLGNTIRFEFAQSIRTVKSFSESIAEIISNAKQRKRMEYLRLSINYLINRLNNEFAPATGLTAGFSFSDGD